MCRVFTDYVGNVAEIYNGILMVRGRDLRDHEAALWAAKIPEALSRKDFRRGPAGQHSGVPQVWKVMTLKEWSEPVRFAPVFMVWSFFLTSLSLLNHFEVILKWFWSWHWSSFEVSFNPLQWMRGYQFDNNLNFYNLLHLPVHSHFFSH